MAKAPNSPKTPPAAKSRKQGGQKTVSLGFLGLVLVLFFLPTAVFLLIAMTPTIVALFVDRSPRKHLGITVGSLNASGTVPYLFDLWWTDHSLNYVAVLLSQVFPWIVILGAAGLGWLIFLSTPALVATAVTMLESRRLQSMKARQKQLIAEWGDEVAEPNPVSGAKDGAKTSSKSRLT